jgi:DNA-binding transcriptional LysR family regulator
MRHVTLRQLQVFAAVARDLSFSKAARSLHLTQPAVSMQIRQLEQAAGVPLLERHRRATALTEAGRELLVRAHGINELLREAQESIEALRGMRSGTLKLGAVSTAKYFAPSLLADFAPAYPGVSIRFDVANREEIVKQLADNEIDLAIMGRPPRELRTVAEPFARHALVVIAAPDHPLAGRRGIPLTRLESEHFLIREPGSGTRAAMEKTFRERGVRWRSTMEVSSNETIKQAVMAGMGVSFLSIHTVGLELETGRLVALDVRGLPVMRDWYVIHMRDKRLTPVTAAFRDFLLERGAAIVESATGIRLPATRGGRRARP